MGRREPQRPPSFGRRARALRPRLDPAWRLPTKKTPIAWITGTNDAFYSLDAVMKSYEMAAGAKHLCLVPNWDHALPRSSPTRKSTRGSTNICAASRPFAKVSPIVVTNDGGQLVATWKFEGDAVAADLIASYGETGNWRGRYWHTFRASIADHACRATWPAATLPCFVSGAVVDSRGMRSSTPLLRVDASALGLSPTIAVPDHDGCVQWGSFEPAQIEYLVRHTQSGQTRWVPRLSTNAKAGQNAAILESGRTVLPPILATATVPHRFTCFMKAERPVSIGVQLGDAQQDFAITAEWSEVSMNYTPPNDVMGVFPASFVVPSGATALVDEVQFHPIAAGQ